MEVSLTNHQLQDEGATLSRTLLPYLNMVMDYSFLGQETVFICTRFLISLIRHVCDMRETVGPGFVLYGVHLNPSLLKGIFDNPENVRPLREALQCKKFPATAVGAMCQYPTKFLWPELMHFWEGKSESVISHCA